MYKKSFLLILILIMISCLTLISIIAFNSTKNKIVVEANNELDIENKEILEIENQEEELIKDIPTPVATIKPQISYNLTAGKYYIKVNTQMNTITIYTNDDKGEYTIPVKSMICSTGNNTPKNRKIILNGKKWDWKLLFGDVYGQYSTHIDGNILFHSVPYLRKYDHSSLEYWEYDKLGTTCSAGCIRLTVEDAKWIYDNCLYGSIVEFYSNENPGPLGKPTAMKISDNIECRGWDPTDPLESNLWKNTTSNLLKTDIVTVTTPTIDIIQGE